MVVAIIAWSRCMSVDFKINLKAKFPSYLVPLLHNESFNSAKDLSNENEFDLHVDGGGTHFHMNGFVRELVLTQRQKATRKGLWLFTSSYYFLPAGVFTVTTIVQHKIFKKLFSNASFLTTLSTDITITLTLLFR